MPTDWGAIRTEYEQGNSLRVLAGRHNIGKSIIGERKLKEGWTQQQPSPSNPAAATKPTYAASSQAPSNSSNPPPAILPVLLPSDSEDAISIARNGLRQLAKHLSASGDVLLDIKDHKLLSDALTQYVKVLATVPPEPATKEGGLVIPLEKISARTRLEIRRLLADDEAAQRRLREEKTDATQM